MSAFWAPTTANLVPGAPHETTRLKGPSVSSPSWFLVSTYTPLVLRWPLAVNTTRSGVFAFIVVAR